MLEWRMRNPAFRASPNKKGMGSLHHGTRGSLDIYDFRVEPAEALGRKPAFCSALEALTCFSAMLSSWDQVSTVCTRPPHA